VIKIKKSEHLTSRKLKVIINGHLQLYSILWVKKNQICKKLVQHAITGQNSFPMMGKFCALPTLTGTTGSIEGLLVCVDIIK
jgi:hypothetical protein